MSMRLPPQNLEAEQSVLGSLLIDPEAIVKIADILRPEHFYEQKHSVIFEAILELYEKRKPLDLVTVPDKLKKKNLLSMAGGVAYLTDLVSATPTSANIETYANLIKDAYTRRSLVTASSQISELAFMPTDSVNELLDKAEMHIFSISQDYLKQDFVPIRNTLETSFERIEELHKTKGMLRGVPTGLKTLDKILNGLQESNLVILAARPSVGKSSLALNIAEYASIKHNMSVGIFSLEMSREQLVDRMLSEQAGVDNWKISTGNLSDDDFKEVGEAMGLLAEAPIYIDDTPGISVMEMRTKARRLHMDKEVKLIVVDYLQLVRGRNLENRVQEVSEISQALKNLARELKIPVLACAQLSRAVEQRGGKVPQLSDLRESGCLSFESRIFDATSGSYRLIGESVGKTFKTLAVDENFKLVESQVEKVFSTGVKDVYKVTLASGKNIRATLNHKFQTISGWKPLQDIIVGDFISTPREVSVTNRTKTSVSKERLELLGHLIGDGCYIKNHSLQYTTSCKFLAEFVGDISQKGFGINPRIVKERNWYQVYLTNGGNNPIINWLKDLSIFDQRSWEKNIPDFVFGLSKELIAVFLSHLWSTDGCIFENKKNASYTIYYSTSSSTLAYGVSSLLLRFGINARTKTIKYPNSPRFGYHIHISGLTDQLKFLQEIGVFGKGGSCKKATQILSRKVANTNVDILPKEVWGLIKKSFANHNLSHRDFHKLMGWSYSGTQRYKNGISRGRLKAIAIKLKDKWLLNLSESEVFWDRVVSIELGGQEEVFDATIKKNHSFIANNIIVHNSIEQDADVVMFLYRPDEEDRTNVKLLISKHRNGPTGEVDLYFKGEVTKFYEVERAKGE